MPEIKQALSSKLIWALAGMPFGAGQELVRVVSLELRKFSNADSRPAWPQIHAATTSAPQGVLALSNFTPGFSARCPFPRPHRRDRISHPSYLSPRLAESSFPAAARAPASFPIAVG
jgi:hypothetical protein